MQLLQLAAGVALIVVVVVDAVRTTLSVGTGAGRMTGLVTKNLWRAALWVHRRRPSHTMLRSFGVVVLLVSVGLWVVLMIGGWLLVFSSAPGAVVAASDGVPADLAAKVWFTSYAIFSLGNGEYRPDGDVWQLVASVATASGLSLVTLGVSYLVPVVSAVADRRSLALHIATLGRSPTELVRYAAEHPTAFTQHATQLVQSIGKVTQQHLAYPVLHYFHATGPASSAAVATAVLDEAITIMEHGVTGLSAEVAGSLPPLRHAIDHLLHTLQGAFISPAAQAPPPPELTRLRPFPLALVDQATYEVRVAEIDEHRRLLYGMLRDDGWDLAGPDRPLHLDNLR